MVRKGRFFAVVTMMLILFGTISVIAVTSTEKLSKSKSIKDSLPEKFTSEGINDRTAKMILGKSYKQNSIIEMDELRILTITFLGFDDKPHYGKLIVNKKAASELLVIFKELYNSKFEIEKINLIDQYGADDIMSMEDNNTSCFNFRTITNGKGVSKHSLGLAIDINPVQNPYINNEKTLPHKGRDYLVRNVEKKGMIIKGGTCYRIFKKHGWIWGGDWKRPVDYQHFERSAE